MKKVIKTGLLSIFMLWNLSCTPYLDIVPDNTVTLEDYFSTREMALDALAKVYSYLPSDLLTHQSSWLLGDEWIGRPDHDASTSDLQGIRLMRGLQNTQNPILGHWSGTGGASHLYRGIRSADIFLQYIDMVENMSETEIKEWKAHVKFLKAYYTFLLLRQYGPIVLIHKPVAVDALSDELFPRRAKVEDCFDFVLQLIEEALPDLKVQTNVLDLGQINKMIALSVKARVLLYRASPFFNGNNQFYGDFLDHNGEPFFPLEYDKEKWKDAWDAVDEAIKFGEAQGYKLYEYEGTPYPFDMDDYEAKPKDMQTLYDLRMVVVDPWNKELIWGLTHMLTGTTLLSSHTNIYLPAAYTSGITLNMTMSEQWLAASFKTVETYYTKNGVPINDDLTFNKNIMFDIVRTPDILNPEYEELRGFMQPDVLTIPLYLNREPRFYANMGITGGYWRTHGEKIPTMMFAESYGGYNNVTGRIDLQSAFFRSGIGIKKFTHPESKSGNWSRLVRHPYPIMRMADLYLMKAEILNEYLDEGDPKRSEMFDAINKVRKRAGLRNVEDVWADANIVSPRALNKHLTKNGMRDIVLQERSIELAFEGSRFWDMHRHKRAVTEFSSPVTGWGYTEADAETFFILRTLQSRRFIERDYLWPISLDETNTNGNLIQNPGW
ncbi:MAG: RagB/SusD family nutrient uptake outer membrane protein [Prevotellaceae bacterium]|jgi:hypothetical protein|nr:RagB/SusD family nutrient uptake outer membrane protein [Prevotellaceae bacterium]